MAKKPDTVPEAAEWSIADGAWVVIPRDAEGKEHGLALYWRPDGTLFCQCPFEHGQRQGWFKRFHPSGEVSVQATFFDGNQQGTQTISRSASSSPERFPANLPENIWLVETDMQNNTATVSRYFDRDKRQVNKAGEPIGIRPEPVSEGALLAVENKTWFWGRKDDLNRRDGVWRFWGIDGALLREIEYAHGEELWNREYWNNDDAMGEVALREKRPADALAPARHWWSTEIAAGDGMTANAVFAGHLLLKVLESANDAAGGSREELLAVAHAVLAMDGKVPVSRRQKEWVSEAFAKASEVLAADALMHGTSSKEWEEGLALADQALRYHAVRDWNADARLIRIRLLVKLNRKSDAYPLVRDYSRSVDPKPTKEIKDIQRSPEYQAWLPSVTSWAPSVYLKEAVKSGPVTYDWNLSIRRSLHGSGPVTDLTTLPWAGWSDAAICALTIAVVEWVVARLLPLHDDPTPQDAVAAAWCTLIDRRRCESLELSAKDWSGPIRGPLLMAITLMHEVLFECPAAKQKPRHGPLVAARLVEYVCADSLTVFASWKDTVVNRLNSLSSEKVIPPQVSDSTTAIDPRQFTRLSEAFLQHLDSRYNPFLIES